GGTRLEATAQLGEALLALAAELMQRAEGLQDGLEIGADVAAQLHEGILLRRDRRLHHGDQPQQRITLGAPGAVGPRHVGPQALDLELHLADVAPQSAPGGEPQAEDERYEPSHVPYGFLRTSPPLRISNSSRRFWGHESSSCP